jgi:hypothetical protein
MVHVSSDLLGRDDCSLEERDVSGEPVPSPAQHQENDPEHRSRRFLKNNGTHLSNYTVQYPKLPTHMRISWLEMCESYNFHMNVKP